MIVIMLLMSIIFACVNCIVMPKAEIEHLIRLNLFLLTMIFIVWLASLHVMIFSDSREDEIGGPIVFTMATFTFIFMSCNVWKLIKQKQEYNTINP